MVEPVGKRLKRLLDERLGGNQSELARRSGIDRAYISQVIGGRTSDMRLETAHALARGLGVPASQLVDESPVEHLPDLEAMLLDAAHRVREMQSKEVRYFGSVPASRPAPDFFGESGEHVVVPQLDKEDRNVFAVKVGDDSLEEYGIGEGTTVVLESTAAVGEGSGVYLVIHEGVVMLRILSRNSEGVSVTPPLPGDSGSSEYQVLGRGRWREI